MEFRKFNSLKNTYMADFIERVHRHGYNYDWVVTEKLHGANFSVHCYRDRPMQFASREGYVDRNFYGAGAAIASLAQKADQMASLLFAHQGNLLRVIVYGELTGPFMMNKHPVWYGENHQFHAFEMVLTYPKPGGGTRDLILDWHDFVANCAMVDIPVVPVVGIFESFEDALAVNETFTSRLTPDGYEKQNYAEGVTIAPIIPQFSGETRLWLKKKTSQHNERQKRPCTIEDKALDEAGIEFAEYLLEFVNAQRVDAVLSKLGQVDAKQQGRVLGLALKDAFDEAADCLNEEEGVDEPLTIKEWAKRKVDDQWVLVNQLVTKEMAKLVHEALFNCAA